MHNVFPYRDQVTSPFFMVKKKKENFKNMQTFERQIHVQPPGIREKHFKEDV